MCRAIEEYIEKKCAEIIHARDVEFALAMLKRGRLTFEEISEDSNLPLSEIESLAKTLPA